MKTLSSAENLATIRSRIALVSPTDASLWGSMSVHQMLHHLTEAFACPLGEFAVAPFRPSFIPVSMFKWLALRAPIQWPRGVQAPPEIRQPKPNSIFTDFIADRERVLNHLDRFVRAEDPWPPHPIFGSLSRAEWMRWGYLHCDHHLRQFGR